MNLIELQAVPNQQVSLQIDENFWSIILKDTAGVMGVTISQNNTLLISNIRAVAGELLIPYPYLQSANFFISTLNDELPYWSQFGISQFLYYLSPSDLI